MTLVLISACFVCLQNKSNGHRKYQCDDETTLIELQQLHYPNPSATSDSEYQQPLIHLMLHHLTQLLNTRVLHPIMNIDSPSPLAGGTIHFKISKPLAYDTGSTVPIKSL